MVDEITDFEVLEIALRELCIEKGIFTAAEHRHFTEFAEQIGPTPAARLVARAWLDPEFKALALDRADGGQQGSGRRLVRAHRFWHAQRLHGVPDPREHTDPAPRDRLRVVLLLPAADPRQLPEWYRTPNYRRRLVRWPRQVLAEFGLYLPDDIEVRVQDSNQKHRFMVMPMRPEDTDGWTEDQLAEIITRDSLIGVALPKAGMTTNVITDTRPAVHP